MASSGINAGAQLWSLNRLLHLLVVGRVAGAYRPRRDQTNEHGPRALPRFVSPSFLSIGCLVDRLCDNRFYLHDLSDRVWGKIEVKGREKDTEDQKIIFFDYCLISII